MNSPSGKKIVSIVRYEKPFESVRKAVELSGGLENLSSNAKVFIKPNIVSWTRFVPFPKWGVITTSRVVEDIVVLLKERGIDDITIGEGMVILDIKDRETPAHAFESLGYNVLNRKYGVKSINVYERPFKTVDLGEGEKLNFNVDILQSDFVIDIPVLKTHAQTVVSLGIKNLKGILDIKSRKKCHRPDPKHDLNFMISKLLNGVLPHFTILDGIFTNERGPAFDGNIRKSNILVASSDILSADMVGARILGHNPSDVPYLAYIARNYNRPVDLSDIEITGEKIEDVESRHEYSFVYDKEGELPLPLNRMGIRGLSYRKYDLTMCTYCSFLNGMILNGIANAWKGKIWDNVEVLTGKVINPTPGKNKTILLGKCIYQAHKNNPDIKEMIAVKGCPPTGRQILKAFHKAGIELDPEFFENLENGPGSYMKKFEGRPEFDESFFRITDESSTT